LETVPRDKNGTNLAESDVSRAVWFDIEKRVNDPEPAITGVLVDGMFKIIVNDDKLASGASYSNLDLQNGETFFKGLIRKCKQENRLLISYTKADYEYIINAYPHLKTGLDEVYQKTKFTSWFRNQRPELFEEMQRKLANRAGNRRARNRPRQRQNGEYRVGLNDMLKLEAVSYPDRSSVGIGGSANAIRKVRERYEKTGEDLEKITTGEKKAWSKMLSYLEHDVRGLEHLTRWINS
jgi:hypothetical protein